MKLVIERTAFADLLGRVAPASPSRSTIPILNCARLTAADAFLKAEATDMDLKVADVAPAQVERPGQACVEAARLDAIVRALPAGSQVDLDWPEGSAHLTVRAGRSRFSLGVVPAEDFPEFGPMEGAHEFTLPIPSLRWLLRAVRYAISSEQTRYCLCGAFLHVDSETPDRLKACATDGRRLAMASLAIPEGARGMPGVILPSAAVDLLLKHLPEKGDVEVAVTERAMAFRVAEAIWRTKLIDGQFPDYVRVIPTGGTIEATLDVKQTTAAIKRVGLAVDSEKSGARMLAFDLAENSVRVRGRGETSEAEETVECSLSGAAVTIGFNGAYLIAALEHAGGDTATLQIIDPGSPGRITNPADDSTLHVVMPARVN